MKVLTLKSLFIFGLLFSFVFFIQQENLNPFIYAQTPDESGINNIANSNNDNQEQQLPNLNAEDLYNTKTMTVGNNVENLVILIPNEGHHDEGEDNEARFLDQHFVPENAVINTGTTVAWFNGDVGHERTINVMDTDGNSVLFTTGEIEDSQISPSHTFTTPGIYNYEAEGDPGVTMEGTIRVVADGENSSTAPSTAVISPSPSTSTTTNSTSGLSSGNIDTVGFFMVPTQDIDDYLSQIAEAGITVESTHDFEDLRGGQKGTGDVQTLIVWSTTSADKDLTETISSLREISLDLPYS